MVVFKEKKRPRNMTDDELRDHKRLLGRMASKRYYDKHRERLRSEKSKRYSLARYYKLKNETIDSDVVEVDDSVKKI